MKLLKDFLKLESKTFHHQVNTCDCPNSQENNYFAIMKAKRTKIDPSENVIIQNTSLDSISGLNLVSQVDPHNLMYNSKTIPIETPVPMLECFKISFEFVQPIRIINDLPFDISLFFLTNNKKEVDPSESIIEYSKLISERELYYSFLF